MRQVLIDEISSDDISKLNERLMETAAPSGMEGLYWVLIPEEVLDPDQKEVNQDHPFCFAVEVGESWAKFEFLIRSRTNMSSLQTRYASRSQQEFILDFSNRLIDDLNLKT